jgi:hypothetical protein
VLIPAAAIFALLIRLPDADLWVLGFDPNADNHPSSAVLSVLPVLPPVSRPAARTLNLKTGAPFVVEDTITTEYQTILAACTVLRTASDRQQLWVKFMEMHVSIERIFLDQGKTYPDHAAGVPSGKAVRAGAANNHALSRVVSMRSRWVGKGGYVLVQAHNQSGAGAFGERAWANAHRKQFGPHPRIASWGSELLRQERCHLRLAPRCG